jgi:2-dehydropantoate 2-reductase
MKLNYAIIGSGALGGYYGGKLAQAGHNVHFLFHNDYNFVKTHGLEIDSVKGDFKINPINAYQNTSQMPVCDVILVCLKTNNNHLLNQLLPPILHEHSVVVLLQNGLGIENDLAVQFPKLSIAGGLAFICSSKTGNGHISHFDMGSVKIGSFQNKKNEVLEQICSDFNSANVPAEYSENLNLTRWQKLVWNIPYNGLTVVLNTTTDNLMKHTSSRQLIFEIMLEVVEAANICGAQIGADFAQKMMHTTDKMKPYAPSMKVDFDAKRPMEIKTIYSNPIQAALNAGYSMKKTTMLEQQLQFIQSKYI